MGLLCIGGRILFFYTFVVSMMAFGMFPAPHSLLDEIVLLD